VAAHGSVIIGATSLAQLQHNVDAFLLPPERLTEEIEREIDAVHMRCRDPSNSL
jgi:aryl-alcohol dehydrogenase-like predicted oxidoreductase